MMSVWCLAGAKCSFTVPHIYLLLTELFFCRVRRGCQLGLALRRVWGELSRQLSP